MTTKNFLWSSIIAMVCFILVLSACSQSTTPEPSAVAEPVNIRMAVLPIMDTLPLYVAEQEGFFEQNNITVEFIPVASAPERDQLIAAGQADGMINEILSTMLYNQETIQVQTVRYARTATQDYPLFHILVSAQSGIATPEDLKNVPIGISQGTIIEYLTDRILEAQGFSKEEIQTVAVPKLSDRLALLASGELAAAMLPDPLSFLAEQQGARIILDDTVIPELSFSTITFRKEFLDQNPEAVRRFLAAIEQAVLKINENPQQYSALLSERQLVPPPLLETYTIHPYPEAGVPTQAQWEDVLAWAKEKGLLKSDISYAESVTEAYLPK